MKKIFFLTAALICSLSNVNAQGLDIDESAVSSSPFVVWHVEGSAEYLEDGSDVAQKIFSGMTLRETGKLTLNKNSQMKLSWKDQILILSKKGTYSLKNEAKKLADLSASTPAPDIDDFVMAMGAASGFGEPGAGDGETEGGSAKRDTSGGYDPGTREALNVIMPVGGLVPLDQITFSWAGISGPAGFRITVYDKTDKTPVFSAMTMNNSFTVDVAQLSLNEVDEYQWQVENASNPGIKSGLTTIMFTKKDQDMYVIRGLQSDREYSYSDPWLKLLREAHALQKENLLYSANEKYRQGLKSFSNNQMVKKMYALFLTNQGLEALAYEVMK